MSDLIDRQAAIDVLNKHSVMFEFHLPHEFHEVKEEIRGLPSAQPTQTNAPNALKSLDCISRQAAINALEFGITYAKAVNRETGEVTELFKQSNDELKKAIERIQKLPTAEPKTGRWRSDRLVTTNGGTYGVRRCSECEAYYQDIGYGWNFCPNCGARMGGDA